MQEEIKAYYRGRKRLAEMMGKDPEAFTDKDVKVRGMGPLMLLQLPWQPSLVCRTPSGTCSRHVSLLRMPDHY